MEKKNIEILLKKDLEKDVLQFQFDTPLSIELNSEDQTNLRIVFYELLNIMIENEVKLELKIADGYEDLLYKEIATEYVKQLDLEIGKIFEVIQEKFPAVSEEKEESIPK